MRIIVSFHFIHGIRFFFFQAEDGIRGVAVTGVQTCALPIPPAAFQALYVSAEPPEVLLIRFVLSLNKFIKAPLDRKSVV